MAKLKPSNKHNNFKNYMQLGTQKRGDITPPCHIPHHHTWSSKKKQIA